MSLLSQTCGLCSGPHKTSITTCHHGTFLLAQACDKCSTKHIDATKTCHHGMFSSVTNMGRMFGHAYRFNQDHSSWGVSSVTDIGGLFNSVASFKQTVHGARVFQAMPILPMHLSVPIVALPLMTQTSLRLHQVPFATFVYSCNKMKFS